METIFIRSFKIILISSHRLAIQKKRKGIERFIIKSIRTKGPYKINKCNITYMFY